MRLAPAAGLAALSLLAACATVRPAAGPTAPPPTGPALAAARSGAEAFAELPGWAGEDHAGALAAFRQTCGAARDALMAAACARARGLADVAEPSARHFLEANFRPQALPGDGLLTGYFAPEYEARDHADGEFSAPVRPRPGDLPAVTVPPAAYPDRTDIDARPSADAVAWMRPEDLFFLQVQGSGSLTFPDGHRLRAVYDGNNGLPFVGVARPLRERGLLTDANTSAANLHGWLAAHRGAVADAIMRLNPRYVFFRLVPDDGGQPAGTAGAPLPPGRAIAIDATRHAMGEVYWLDARAPALSGAFPIYQRLAVALDTGGAIQGDVRADLYLGRGPAAGEEAGRIRHVLHLYRLVPVAAP